MKGTTGAETRCLDTTLAYHQRSKHYPHRLAASLGYLDWDTQPDPFRRFRGAPEFPLKLRPVGPLPLYEPAFCLGSESPVGLDGGSVGQLFQDALGLSAWKEIPGSRWALRVNPSSGNLHPTEGYLVARSLPGLHEKPAVYHYAPRDHLLELRAELSDSVADRIFDPLSPDAILVGLTSIHWREAWKYGERAFRYCQHDVGHAIGCVSIAAAGLGWAAWLLEGVTDDALAALLGVRFQKGVEAEHPEGLMAVAPQNWKPGAGQSFRLDHDLVAALVKSQWRGTPNALSGDHHDWPGIDEVAAATKKRVGPGDRFGSESPPHHAPLVPGDSTLPLRRVIHQRRSAVALDARTGITRNAFYQILRKAAPGANQIPFSCLPWPASIDLLLLVHRVEGLAPGLYAQVRNAERKVALQAAMDPRFAWVRSEGCPDVLDVSLLEEGEARRAAQQASCNQRIAADGAFAMAMIADYRRTLEDYGPWFYRRLFWESGVIGQVLYLEAEASGIRGTGIGCFFDDLTHRLFGIEDDRFQILYHFTMGGAVDDPRLQTLPPYAHLGEDSDVPESSSHADPRDDLD
jgi:SagB-type dehydrogenase family enzyme